MSAASWSLGTWSLTILELGAAVTMAVMTEKNMTTTGVRSISLERV